jgi:hypothetical protein
MPRAFRHSLGPATPSEIDEWFEIYSSSSACRPSLVTKFNAVSTHVHQVGFAPPKAARNPGRSLMVADDVEGLSCGRGRPFHSCSVSAPGESSESGASTGEAGSDT